MDLGSSVISFTTALLKRTTGCHLVISSLRRREGQSKEERWFEGAGRVGQ